MLKSYSSRMIILLLTAFLILSGTGAVYAAQSIEYTTNGAAKQYVAGSVLVLYGKVTDSGKAVPNTAVTLDIRDSNSKTIYYGQLKTNSSGYFKTTFTIPDGVSGTMTVSIKTSALTLDPMAYSLNEAGSFYLVGFIPQGYLEGESVSRISVSTEKLGLVFNANVNYFNNKNNNLDLDSLGVNERNRDCVELYERQSDGDYVRIPSAIDMVVSDNDGGEQVVSGITYLPDVPAEEQKFERKDVLYVVPANGLELGTTYKVVVDGDLTANNSATLGEEVTVYFTTRSASSGSSGSDDETDESTTEESGPVDNGENTTAANFTDIAGHWAEYYINAMVQAGIVKGITETTFAPEQSITRAEFAVLLSRILELDLAVSGSAFSDVPANAWYYQGVTQAAAAEIVMGDDGLFKPQEKISREELATMLARAYSYAGGNPASGLAVNYRDRERISAWAVDAVSQVGRLQIMNGYQDGTFGPLLYCDRGEAVKTLKVFMDLLEL